MEIIVLDRNDFTYKDYAFVSEFEINLDMVVTQKSTFKINKHSLNANTGDYLYVKNADAYFGILENIEDEKTHLVLSSVDFKEIFKVEVLATNFEGDLADYLVKLMSNTYLNNTDSKENMHYLKLSKETTKTGSLSFDEDKIITIYEILELVNKMYGIYIKHDIIFENGSFKEINIRIVNVVSGVKIKADLLNLEDLTINDSSKENVNKVTYLPKKSNLYFKSTIDYYLLTDGTVSKDKSHFLRFNKVIRKIQTYSDNDYLELDTKVLSLLLLSKTDHQISFTLNRKSHSLEVLKSLTIGDFVAFIYRGKTYDSLITGMRFLNSFDVCVFTLGEYRVKLTEKLQILNKNLSGQVGNVTINKSGLSDLDGGEF